MAALQYKTRGKESPQGKPRVYFCCHPLDFELYFSAVTDDLLDAQKNCAIWYDAEPLAAYDDLFLSDLAQMQLFVMPVTSRLLTEPNRAMDVEFPLAVSHHIPVLPLLQEQGLEALFNEKCGSLQYLDSHEEDATAIPYMDKLRSFLSGVLIGDELAEKIRAAFDAYVFLSYRKKDRKYAQELMRLIHRNDFCRDIAIWYDEFLNPGENFNDAIRDAMEKSTLFVLTVTPNLVNEVNYIMTTEYPLAQTRQKSVLPAELVQTDRGLLHERYEALPPCVDAYDAAALSDALYEALRDTALMTKDTSAEHRFFIGLAYQGGVDVEIDHQRALTLITSAAEEGLTEAVDHLVEMYRSGLGVERSVETAVVWQERKVALCRAEFDAEPSESNSNRLFWALSTCGELYRGLGRYAEAMERYLAAEDYLLAAADPKTARWAHNLTYVYSNLSKTCRENGDYEPAERFLKLAFRLTAVLADTLPTQRMYSSQLFAWLELGQMYLDLNALDKAKLPLEMALHYGELLVENAQSESDLRCLCLCLYELSRYHEMCGNLTEAKSHCEKELSLREVIAEATGETADKHTLSDRCLKLAKLLVRMGEPKAAKQIYEKALQVERKIAEKTKSEQDRHRYGYTAFQLIDLAETAEEKNRYTDIMYSVYDELSSEFPDNELYRECFEYALFSFFL